MRSARQPFMAYATIMAQYCPPWSRPCMAVERVLHGIPCCTSGPHGRDHQAAEAL